MKPTLYLVRGLPGTGKSTIAKRLTAFVVEADMYFIDKTTGEYRFNPDALECAHQWCQNTARKWMAMGVDVAVSNTFMQHWEMQPYYELTKLYDYRIAEIVMKGAPLTNLHNVPQETINRMQARWEP